MKAKFVFEVFEPISKEKSKEITGFEDLTKTGSLIMGYRDDNLSWSYGANANVHKHHFVNKNGANMMNITGPISELYKVYRYYNSDDKFKEKVKLDEALKDVLKPPDMDSISKILKNKPVQELWYGVIEYPERIKEIINIIQQKTGQLKKDIKEDLSNVKAIFRNKKSKHKIMDRFFHWNDLENMEKFMVFFSRSDFQFTVTEKGYPAEDLRNYARPTKISVEMLDLIKKYFGNSVFKPTADGLLGFAKNNKDDDAVIKMVDHSLENMKKEPWRNFTNYIIREIVLISIRQDREKLFNHFSKDKIVELNFGRHHPASWQPDWYKKHYKNIQKDY